MRDADKSFERLTAIESGFALQVRIAADDPEVTEGTLRQGLRDAAGIMDKQQELVRLLYNEVRSLRSSFVGLTGLLFALLVVNTIHWMGWV